MTLSDEDKREIFENMAVCACGTLVFRSPIYSNIDAEGCHACRLRKELIVLWKEFHEYKLETEEALARKMDWDEGPGSCLY